MKVFSFWGDSCVRLEYAVDAIIVWKTQCRGRTHWAINNWTILDISCMHLSKIICLSGYCESCLLQMKYQNYIFQTPERRQVLAFTKQMHPRDTEVGRKKKKENVNSSCGKGEIQ